ncbi:beta-N-acetylglucosaminidase domain-containing protein [Mycoplasma sp. CSL10166]|uniref:beta-N-acetylglucosaminidase domain-containing protein n=1 Tax=Mycoplasma sp. CSL10166 TaxID=2813825 RepID=UPI00197B8689|nr:beta-N-acetylglucosaminidase domain-containing protein [Mycoplasma sp. CSL10166]MBN4084449.1 beta-N-acetylglucosaminidase domain-containing protein [Mycoplasma sp. CSL10166]
MKINKKFLNKITLLGVTSSLFGLVSLNSSNQTLNETELNDSEKEVSKIEYTINPNPHNLKYFDNLSFISSKYTLVRGSSILSDKYLDHHIKSVLNLKSTLESENTLDYLLDKNNLNTRVLIGIKGSDDEVSKYIESKYESEIDNDFNKFDAYSLVVKNNNIVIIAKDKEGVFAAFNTLSWIFEEMNGQFIRDLVINDYADTKIRGFIEGYYGVPWSWDDRSSMMTLAGKYKANSYIFAPKDDPYHSVKWDELYPSEEIEKMKKTVEAGHYAGVEFTWTVHPWINKSHAIDLQNNYDSEVTKLKAKFKQMYDEVGIRQFGLLADDIDGQPFNLVKKLIEDLVAWGSEEGREVKGFVFVPTKYEGMSNTWSGTVAQLQQYQRELPDNSKVWIVYTGANVFGSVETRSINWWVNTSGTNRSPLFWLNWPVNDPDYTALNLGPGTMLNNDVEPSKLLGVVTNPMQEGELSKIAISAISSYTWNIKDFDAWKEWKESFYKIAPEAPEALMKLASHMTSTSKDGTRWGVNIDDESKDIRPLINSITNSLNSNNNLNESDREQLLSEMESIIDAYDEFMHYSTNEKMKQEMELFGLSLSKIAETIKNALVAMKLFDELNSYDFNIRLKQAKLFEAYQYADKAREAFNFAKHLIREDLKEGSKPRDKEKIVRPGNQYLEPLAKLILNKINFIKSKSGNINLDNLYVSKENKSQIANSELYKQTVENESANSQIISNIDPNNRENVGAAYIGASKIEYLSPKDETKQTLTLKGGQYIAFDLNVVSQITSYNLVLDGKDKDNKKLKKYYSTTFDKINSVPKDVSDEKPFIARYIILFNDSEEELEFSITDFSLVRSSHVEQITNGANKQNVEKVNNYRVHSSDYNEEMNMYKYLFQDSDFIFTSHSDNGELVIESESDENALFNEFYIKQDPLYISHALVYATVYNKTTGVTQNKKMGNLDQVENFFRAPLDKDEIVLKLNIQYRNSKLHLDKIDVLSNFNRLDYSEVKTALEDLKESRKKHENITFTSNQNIDTLIFKAEELLKNKLGYSQIAINRLRNELIKSKYVYDVVANQDNINKLDSLVAELEKYSSEDLTKKTFVMLNNNLLTFKSFKNTRNNSLTNDEVLKWIDKLTKIKSKLVFDKSKSDRYLELYTLRKDLLSLSTSNDYPNHVFEKMNDLINNLDKYYDNNESIHSNSELSSIGEKLSELKVVPLEKAQINDESLKEINILENSIDLITKNNILKLDLTSEYKLLDVTRKNLDFYSKEALNKRNQQIKEINAAYFEKVSKIVKSQLTKFKDKLDLLKPSNKYINSKLFQKFVKDLGVSIDDLNLNKNNLNLDKYLEEYLRIKDSVNDKLNSLSNNISTTMYLQNLYDIDDNLNDIFVQWKRNIKYQAEKLLSLEEYDPKTYSDKVEELYQKGRDLETLELKKDTLNKMYQDFLTKKQVLSDLLEKSREAKDNSKPFEIYSSTTKLVNNIETSLKENPQNEIEFAKLLDQTDDLINTAHKYSLIESNIGTKPENNVVVIEKESPSKNTKKENNVSSSLVLLIVLNAIVTFGMALYLAFKKIKKNKNN